jgi:hypothetical protein
MKNLKEIAKKIQKNCHTTIRREFKDTLKRLDKYYNFRNNKELRSVILPKLERCMLVSGKIPTVVEKDIFEITAQLQLNEYFEDRIIKLVKARVPTIENIYKDLVFLKKEFDNITFNHGMLSVRTKDIVLKGINFGPFDIYLDTIDLISIHICDDVGVEVKAITPNFSSSDSSYPHPHVEDTSLCVGEGKYAIGSAIRGARILDYFSIVNAIMNTYGVEPYEDIDAWSRDSCYDCRGKYSPSEMKYCETCGEIYCRYCISECGVCGEFYCAFCTEHECACNVCGNFVCNDCKNECVVCRNICCDDCAEDSCCGKACVDSCCERCEECGDPICNSCILTCSECSETYCQNCVEKCDKCNEPICESCMYVCDTCGISYHDKCEFKCCR